MTAKGDENRFVGMWEHKGSSGYEIEYVKDGQHISEYRKSKVAAEKRADHWRQYFENREFIKPEPIDSHSHPALFWERKLREAAEFILANPGNDLALDAGKVLASMATAGMRAAAYHPPPEIENSGEDNSKVAGNANMTTEELKALLGDD